MLTKHTSLSISRTWYWTSYNLRFMCGDEPFVEVVVEFNSGSNEDDALFEKNEICGGVKGIFEIWVISRWSLRSKVSLKACWGWFGCTCRRQWGCVSPAEYSSTIRCLRHRVIVGLSHRNWGQLAADKHHYGPISKWWSRSCKSTSLTREAAMKIKWVCGGRFCFVCWKPWRARARMLSRDFSLGSCQIEKSSCTIGRKRRARTIEAY